MKTQLRNLLSILTLCTFTFFSCHKKGNDITGGGKGGNATIRVTPEAHGTYVDSCTVYIKYGSLDAPTNGLYDDSGICVLQDTIPVVTFSNLKTGLYYIYGRGYHVGFTQPYVKGGYGYTMSSESTQTIPLQLGAYTP